MVSESLLDGPALRALSSIMVIMLGFVGIGRFVAIYPKRNLHDDLDPAYHLIAGWAGVSTLVTVFGFSGLGQGSFLLAILALGIVGFLLPLGAPRERGRVIVIFATAAGLLLPLLVVSASIPGVMYDEFAQWLPNARHLYDTGLLPSAAHPNPLSAAPSYPYAGALVNDLGSLLAGQFLETPSKLLTVMLFGNLGLALAIAAQGEEPRRLGLGAIAAGILAATVLNPTFDPRNALTSYMDSPSAALVAFLGFAIWQGHSALERRKLAAARDWFRRGGLTALALVFARETNIVFVAALALGLSVVGVSTFARGGRATINAGAWLLLPPAIGFAFWRLYMVVAGLRSPLGFRPLDQWEWHDPALVFGTLVSDRFANHPWLGSGFILVILGVFAVTFLGWPRVRLETRRLVIIIGVLVIVWISFLTLAYMGVYTPQESIIAASAWRYASQLGPSIMLCVAALLGDIFRPYLPRTKGWPRSAAVGAALLATFGIQLASSGHWHIECQFADVTATRRVAALLESDLSPAARILLVHPTEGDWLALAANYQLHLSQMRVRGVAVDEGADLAQALAALPAPGNGLVLDLRPLQRNALAAGNDIPRLVLYAWSPGASEESALKPRRVLDPMPNAPFCAASR